MKNTFIIGAVLLVVGLGLGYFIGVNNSPSIPTPQNSNMHQMADGMNMSDSMSSMTAMLQGKKGDELDQTFLDEMVKHHEGAVEMSKILVEGTNRPELIQFGKDIISTQTREIETMKRWRSEWFGK